jgi:hypothetical protein
VLSEGGHERARHPGERGQEDHEQVEAVDPKLVANAELWDPLVVRHVLQAPGAGVEVGEQHDRVGEYRDGPRQHRPARVGARQRRPDQARDQRQEDDDRQVDRHELEIRK